MPAQLVRKNAATAVLVDGTAPAKPAATATTARKGTTATVQAVRKAATKVGSGRT